MGLVKALLFAALAVLLAHSMVWYYAVGVVAVLNYFWEPVWDWGTYAAEELWRVAFKKDDDV